MLAEHWLSEFRDLGDWPRGTFESVAEYIDLFPLVVCVVWSIYGVICLVGSSASEKHSADAAELLRDHSVLFRTGRRVENSAESRRGSAAAGRNHSGR